MENKKTIRDELAEEFINLLSKEESLQWTQGWDAGMVAPYNGFSQTQYRGINRMILLIQSIKNEWKDPRFFTFKQAKEKNYHIKAGEKATKVEYWMAYDKKEEKNITLNEMRDILKNDSTRKQDEFYVFCKPAYVFNVAQIEGIQPLPPKEHTVDEVLLAEEVLKVLEDNMQVQVVFGGNKAYYQPSTDKVCMPEKEKFFSTGEYYGTMLHELSHATGHPTRLKRPLDSFYADEVSYSLEELRVEIAATYICAELGVPMPQEVIDNHKAYVQSWLQNIKDDHSFLFKALRDADTISDYIMEKGRVEELREKLSVYEKEPKNICKYEVYQLKNEPFNRDIMLMPYEYASKFILSESRYEKKWEAETGKGQTLEDIKYEFTIAKPKGFEGHNLCVSDVIVIHNGEKKTAWYLDRVGFKEIPNFCKEKKQVKKHGGRRSA